MLFSIKKFHENKITKSGKNIRRKNEHIKFIILTLEISTEARPTRNAFKFTYQALVALQVHDTYCSAKTLLEYPGHPLTFSEFVSCLLAFHLHTKILRK